MAARPTLLVAVPLFAVLVALDVPALRALDASTVESVIGGVVAAAVGALFGSTWFGDRGTLTEYGVQRLFILLAVIGLAATGVYFLFEWPVLPSVATGTSIGLVAAMGLLAAFDDI